MSILNNRIFYIDSEKRLSGTPSNFTYWLDIPDDSRFDTACVLNMTIPRSYYLIRAGQNRFTLRIGEEAYELSVRPGNYNVRNFISTLLPMLNQYATFTMTFDEIVGKYTYGTTSTDVSFIFSDPSRLGHQMGFDEVSTNTFVDSSLVSANVVDFVSTSTLFLHSDLVSDRTSILQEIYSDNSVPYSNLVYSCKFPSMYSKSLQTNSSSTFTFSLQDEHDLDVDLNGHELLFTLLLYRKEDMPKLMKSIVQILHK